MSRNEDRSFELRVLAGERHGARSAVAAGATVSVSAEWSSDIVLRGAGLGDRWLTLTPADDGVQIAVLRGEVQAGLRTLHAGDSAALPLYTPLRLGDTVIALGGTGEAGWLALHPGEAPRSDDDAPAAATAADSREEASLLSIHAHRWSRWLAVGGAALAAAAMGVLALAYAAAPAGPTPEQTARRAEAALHAAGFVRLVAAVAPGGDINVTGYLETAEQRARADQLLASRGVPAHFSVWVNELLANAVLDLYRVNGVPARVDVTGPGAVRVTTHENDVSRLEQIKAIARHDVPGLAVIEALNVPPAPAPDNTPALDDPGKRVASIVPGSPSYVVTADGTRYFEGALLPTGHRIAAIGEREVLLEKGGVQTPLKF